MGWKNVKEHYDIGHMVCVTSEGICIGSPRALRDRNNVSRLKATLLSDTVIDVQQQNIKEIVDYTEMGAGSIRARTKDKKRYNSRNHVRHDPIETEQGQENFWERVLDWLGKRF